MADLHDLGRDPAPPAPPDDAAREAHRRHWNAIPWLVNGTLAADERTALERHLAGCPDCREELAFHRQVQAALQAEAPASHDPEPALARMNARIDEDEATAGSTTRSVARATPATRRVRLLAAAVVVQAVALGALFGALLGRPAADYRTLATPAAQELPAAAIRLVPSPDMRLDTLREMLARHRLRIVEASADGTHFGLAPLPAANVRIADAVTALRGEPGVLLAEPLAGSGP